MGLYMKKGEILLLTETLIHYSHMYDEKMCCTYRRVKKVVFGVDQSLPSKSEVENVLSLTSTPPLCLRGLPVNASITFNFLIYFWRVGLYIVIFEVLADVPYRKPVLRTVMIGI